MPRPRHIDIRIEEMKEKLESLQDRKRMDALRERIKRRRGKRRRRTM